MSETEFDYGSHHGDVAARTIHWYAEDTSASGSGMWVIEREGKGWIGWSVSGKGAEIVELVAPFVAKWRPWRTTLDKSDAPFFKWFAGGQTNAAFNEVDRHILSGHGDRTAFILEPPGIDPSAILGSPVEVSRCSYRDLLIESSLAASAIKAHGLNCGGGIHGSGGSRIALLGPNTLDQIVWIQAAKRLGIPYTCIPEGASIDTSVARVRSLGAELVYVSEGSGMQPSLSLLNALLKHCIVVVGGLIMAGENKIQNRQAPSHPPTGCLDAAALRCHALSAHPDALLMFDSQTDPVKLVQCVWSVNPPVPVESNYPLFVAFTSGSTGRPKGLVHSHATMACVCHTLSFSFGVPPPTFKAGGIENGIEVDKKGEYDRALIVATPAWITGQSYMISACLTAGITSILLEGSPVAPSPTRFARVIERHRVTIFKAGSTFLRQVMADPRAIEKLQRCDLSSVRAASFCAEPVSPTVHAFAIKNICSHYVNSYWASEHGGIVFTRKFVTEGNQTPADARCEPVPWIRAHVMVNEGGGRMRDADDGERGEIVLGMRRPFPSLARTIWGDRGQFETGSPRWRGNFNAFCKTYFCRSDDDELLFVQGDFAERHPDGSFSFHGRSDDVMNIGGQRIGTGEIEAALYKHKKIYGAQSPVANCVVVGASDPIKGDIPIAFVVPVPGMSIDATVRMQLQTLAIETVGVLAAPACFIVVPSLPQTRTGKYMRRMLSDILNGVGSVEKLVQGENDDALVNPESLKHAHDAVMAAKKKNGPQRFVNKPTHHNSENADMLDLLILLARQVSSWEDARRQTNTIVTEQAETEVPLDQPLMHLGFDSMRLVIFRDSIMRALPKSVKPPALLFHLFGAEGLENSTLSKLTEAILAAVASARDDQVVIPADWLAEARKCSYMSKEDAESNSGGWHTGDLRKARIRGADAGIILERDNREDKRTSNLIPKGGLEACFRGDIATAKRLFYEDGWSAQHAICQQDSTACHWAATGGNLDVLRWLVKEVGCNINVQNKVGRTPLMFAAKYGHCECIRWMVREAGADIRIRAADDSDVLAWAVYGGDISTLETVAGLLTSSELHHKNKFGCSAIHWAATGGNVEVLKWLFSRGLDFGVINDAGYGAVSKAAYHRHKAALQWLLLDKAGPLLLSQLKRPPMKDLELHSLDDLVLHCGWKSTQEFLRVNSGKISTSKSN